MEQRKKEQDVLVVKVIQDIQCSMYHLKMN